MSFVTKSFNDNNFWQPNYSIWNDRFSHNWDDWSFDWPRPRKPMLQHRNSSDKWYRDWSSNWPRMDTITPRFSSHLNQCDRDWRQDPFWRDIYPKWAEPIFKEGIDVKTTITNDQDHFVVDIDTYQFRPEQLQVKILDNTLLIEGRHEDVRDSNNYTKMYFVRKYELPSDVLPEDIKSSINDQGRLTVEAKKRFVSNDKHERIIPIESSSRLRSGSRNNSYSSRDINESGRISNDNFHHNLNSPQNRSIYEGFNSPTNYRTEYNSQSTDTNGPRHEMRRENYREEFWRTGSQTSLLNPINDYQRRNDSFNNNNNNIYPHRSSTSSRNEVRIETSGTEHYLRSINENGEQKQSPSNSVRNIRIQRI